MSLGQPHAISHAGKKVAFQVELSAAAPAAHASLFHSGDLLTDHRSTDVLVGTQEQLLSAKNVFFLSPNLCEFEEIFPQ